MNLRRIHEHAFYCPHEHSFVVNTTVPVRFRINIKYSEIFNIFIIDDLIRSICSL